MELSLSTSSANVDHNRATTSTDITIGGLSTGWRVTAPDPLPSWFSLSDNSGTANTTLTITYEENTTGTARSADIVITALDESGATSVTQTFALMQSPAPPSLTTDPASLDPVGSDGDAIEVTIMLEGSAMDWTASKVDANDFITLSPTSGDATNNKFTITYTANEGVSERMATITLTSTGGSGAPATKTLMLTQAGMALFVPSASLEEQVIFVNPATQGSLIP